MEDTFPDRVFTEKEVKRAREAIGKGYRHRLRVMGSPDFRGKVNEALKLVKTAKYYDFLRTYIRKIVEIKGLSQLREEDAAIWANMYAVADPVDAASFFIQKAYQMKEYIDGKLYYGGKAELRTVKKRIEFLRELEKRSRNKAVRDRCKKLLEQWMEFQYP